jgi:hypothetical protein
MRRVRARLREYGRPAGVLRGDDQTGCTPGLGPPRRGARAVTFLGGVSLRRRRPHESGDQEIADLAALADGSLGPERRVALEAEVAASPELGDRLAEQRLAVALARSAAEQVAAPPDLRARVEAQRSSRRARTPRRLALAGAGAAALVIAVGVGVAVLGSGSSTKTLHVALGPTDLAPGAGGTATLTKTSSGWRIVLHATGLPRLDGGRFYQAWLRNASGALVPVGTFNEGVDVTLWSGVSPKEFTTLTVTRERNDGDQSSSGEKVLAGTVAAGD